MHVHYQGLSCFSIKMTDKVTRPVLCHLGVAPATFGAESGPSIPAPFNLAGLSFYQTCDPVGFGAPTGTRLVPIFCV
jgi:hypothetical protein